MRIDHLMYVFCVCVLWTRFHEMHLAQALFCGRITLPSTDHLLFKICLKWNWCPWYPKYWTVQATSSPPHSTTTGFPYNEGAFVWGPFCHMFFVGFFQVSLNVPWKGLRRPKLRMTIYIKKLFSKNCPVLPSLNPWPEKYHQERKCVLYFHGISRCDY